ncbi:MAG TPA: MFS transporter [Candidatus Dormibacteraeota bacterium]|nr:MFS transporter [Candidatus Dormibacteraeota bacterium]
MEATELKAHTDARGHPTEATHIRDISKDQWRSGVAAWLGWTFDGLELHLYTLVAAPFVAQLLAVTATTDPAVGRYSSIIQAAFLLGWALGGGFFGRIGDRLGRARALSLTILTYAIFTGLSAFAQTWWHLLIFRFLSALGVGGEWAVGASLLSETWPRKWRPWLAAVLQMGVNVGILMAVVANYVMAKSPPRYLFLVGILPALLVWWIRKSVPEPEEWQQARSRAGEKTPGLPDLFSREVRKLTLWAVLVCGISLTAHWAFIFWNLQHLRNLPEVLDWSPEHKNHLVSTAMFLVIGTSILGNFFAAWLARIIGYRVTIALMFLMYFATVFGAYCVPRGHEALLWWLPMIGFCQGVFALFTMYLPPLFPVLLRTTGAGFCYNIGRAVAAFGTIFFGLFSQVGNHRLALFYAGFLFIPAAAISFLLPERRD